MKKIKERLDQIIVDKGLIESREKAKAMILSGKVRVNGQVVLKAGTRYSDDCLFEVEKPLFPYVSRGGLKLEKAIDEFAILAEGKIAMDLGASTGGFTDCLLMNGAVSVTAVDVGYGQLHWKLRSDNRVRVLERVNARNLKDHLEIEKFDIITGDLSFISLKIIIPAVEVFLEQNGEMIFLIKPQFEAGREKVGKGVIKDKQVHKDILVDFVNFCEKRDLFVWGLTNSPVKGPEGNIEFLVHLKFLPANFHIDIDEIVENAHRELSSC